MLNSFKDITLSLFFIKKEKKIEEINTEEVNVIKQLGSAFSQIEGAKDRKGRITQAIMALQEEERALDNFIRGKEEILEAYGKVRYTEELLDLLIQEEILSSKRLNLIRLKDEIMKGTMTPETIVSLIILDKKVKKYIDVQAEGSKVAKLFQNITKMGE